MTPTSQNIHELKDKLKVVKTQATLACEVSIDLGRTYILAGEFQKAEKAFENAIKLAQKVKDKQSENLAKIGIADVNNMLGNDGYAVNEYFAALLHLNEAHHSIIYQKLAIYYTEANAFDRAEDYAERARRFHLINKTLALQAKDCLVKALLFSAEKNYLSALQQLNKGLSIAKEYNFIYDLLELKNRAGRIFCDIKMYKEATRVFREVAKDARHYGYKYLALEAEIYFSYSLVKDGNTLRALIDIEDYKTEAKELDYKPLYLTILELEYDAFVIDGDKVAAHNKLLEIVALKKSLNQLSGSKMQQLLDAKEKELTYMKGKFNALQNMSEDIRRFKYIFAHQLKEPIRNIGSYSTLILRNTKNKIDTTSEEYLKTISEASSKMNDMYSNILDYLEIGNQSKDFNSLETIPLINEIKSLLKNNYPLAKITISLPPTIDSEAKLFKRLLYELCSNAILHNPNNENLKVEIDYKDYLDKYEISVTDNGIGIENTYHEKVFDFFTKLNPNMYPKSSGMGLPIAKKIVSLSQGKIWVDALYTQGLRICLTIKKY